MAVAPCRRRPLICLAGRGFDMPPELRPVKAAKQCRMSAAAWCRAFCGNKRAVANCGDSPAAGAPSSPHSAIRLPAKSGRVRLGLDPGVRNIAAGIGCRSSARTTSTSRPCWRRAAASGWVPGPQQCGHLETAVSSTLTADSLSAGGRGSVPSGCLQAEFQLVFVCAAPTQSSAARGQSPALHGRMRHVCQARL